jgi:homoserine kinase type II
MAVYTHLEQSDIVKFLEMYDLGSLQSFQGIETGIENSNYHVITDQSRYILTIFEKRVDPRDLPFFFAFMNHLAKQKIGVPRVIADKDGVMIQTVNNKKAVLISYLKGRGITPSDITPELCGEMGALSARLHVGAISFDSSRPNSMGLITWKKLFNKIQNRLHEIDNELEMILRGQLLEFETMPHLNLPRAVIHADLFPDNIFIADDHLSGVIDFYFSCNDFLGYDLALTINAWCFDSNGRCDPEKLAHFMSEYEMIRPMAPEEKRMMNIFFRMAAVRILLTRAHDWLFRDPNALVTPKDPKDYLKILNYHRDHHVIA